jgi:hypothetical protein
MFPFPKIDNKMILIISVFLILYVLTLEKAPNPIKKIQKQVDDNVIKPVVKLVKNPFPSAEQNSAFFTQTCKNGMNMPPGITCPEEFTQDKECPNVSELLASQIKDQNMNWKKARDIGLPFPADGPTAEVKYVGQQENDSWFNDAQYDTIQKIVEDPSRQMKTTQGNVIPAGGDTRAWPELYQTDQQVAALILQSLPTQGNNVQMNQLSA